MQAPRVNHVSFDQQQRGMQQMSRANFNEGGRAGAGNFGNGGGFRGNVGGAGGATESHGWSRFGEPIHGTSPSTGSAAQGARSFEGSQRAAESSRSEGASPQYNYSRQGYGNGGGQAVRISPPIVQQRAPSYQAPSRGSSGNESRSAPSYSRGGGGGGGGNRGGGGGHGGGHR